MITAVLDRYLRRSLVMIQNRLDYYKPPGKNYVGKNDDIWLVSYPRSGNTWLRIILTMYIWPEEQFSLPLIDRLIPDIYSTSLSDIEKLKDLRIIKSHEPYKSEYKKVIYLVRDSRDVFISYYLYLTRSRYQDRSPKLLNHYLDHYLEGKLYGGNWSEHVGSWLGAHGGNSERFLIIRYEDLKKDTSMNMKKILNFINIDFDSYKLNKAIDESKIEIIRKYEKVNDWKGKCGNSDVTSFFQTGIVGKYREYLDKSQENRILEKSARFMELLNYDI